MNENQKVRVRAIVQGALDLAQDEIEAYLNVQCGGDMELHAEVQRVLDAVEGMSADFLEPPGPGEDASGHQLGDFEIISELGRGGMAVVYLAKQQSLGREVALKVLVAGFTTSAQQVERFHREARAVGRLQHPGIVQVFADGSSGATHWFAMEYVPGHDLAREIQLQLSGPSLAAARPILPGPGEADHISSVARICADLADALHYAHGHGLIHRDVKPNNILVQATGRIQLVDFGLARDESLGSLTQTGEIAGTPYYMSPEQAHVRQAKVDHRTDVYSLGVVLYELLTLRRPFEGNSSDEVLKKVKNGTLRGLRRLNKKVPRDLETICGKAMALDPQARYEDAAELAADLRRFLRREAIHAEPPSLVTIAGVWTRRHYRMIASCFILLLGLASGAQYREVQAGRARLASMTVQFSGGLGAASHISLRALDPLSGLPGERIELGKQPLEARLIEPGYYRVGVAMQAGSLREFTRRAEAGKPLRVDVQVLPSDPQSSQMVRIEGGTLELRGDTRLSPLEGRSLHIEPFMLDIQEVSNGQYRRFLEASAYPPPDQWQGILSPEHDALPVVNVGWLDALAYAEWAGKRLPSFAEWSWAARGASLRLYPWSAEPDAEPLGNTNRALRIVPEAQRQANYLANVAPGISHPEARTPSGLYHMLGNVSEWTESPFAELTPEGFSPRPEQRYVVSPAWDCSQRGARHGSLAWFAFDGYERTYANFRTGFRCAQSIP